MKAFTFVALYCIWWLFAGKNLAHTSDTFTGVRACSTRNKHKTNEVSRTRSNNQMKDVRRLRVWNPEEDSWRREMNLPESADVGLLREKFVVQTLFQRRPLGGAVVLQENQNKHNG